MKRVITTTLLLAAMIGCSKEQSTPLQSSVVATFDKAEIVTRTSGETWESEDKVGIYMYESGASDESYLLTKLNVPYESDASGNFTVSTGVDPIYYPQSDMVDFYAYYPYQAAVGTGTSYTADITLQNLSDGSFDQGAVDFMTAKLEAKLKSEESLTFEFDHRLAMVTFVMTPKASVSSMRGVEVTLSEINTSATFSTLTGELLTSNDVMGSVQMLTEESTLDNYDNVTELIATAIFLPEELTSTARLAFKVDDTLTHYASFPTTPTFTAGKNHTYYINVGYENVEFNFATIDGWGESNLPSSDTFDGEEDLGYN